MKKQIELWEILKGKKVGVEFIVGMEGDDDILQFITGKSVYSFKYSKEGDLQALKIMDKGEQVVFGERKPHAFVVDSSEGYKRIHSLEQYLGTRIK